MTRGRICTLLLLLTGVCLGFAGHAALDGGAQPAHAQSVGGADDVPDREAEIESIKGKLPDQSHAMQDVSYHFSNLWFAGQSENWPLADFYWSETRSHLRWAIRIIPLRKDNAGRDVDVKTILQAFEDGTLQELHDTITGHDKSAFEQKYRSALEICYSCHKAADKPFIRLQIPVRPETPIINFDPHAEWPR